MPYQTDYVMRLIEQLGSLLRRTLEGLGAKETEEPIEVAGQAIGLALGMDPDLASRLSPQSLRTLLELGNLDHELVRLVAQAVEVEVGALGAVGDEATVALRQGQAGILRAFLAERRPAGGPSDPG